MGGKWGSNKIRELREARGWSCDTLAEHVRNTSGEQIRKLEAGERKLSKDWLDRIAAALQCHPTELWATDRGGGESHDEAALLTEFRRLPPSARKGLVAFLRKIS